MASKILLTQKQSCRRLQAVLCSDSLSFRTIVYEWFAEFRRLCGALWNMTLLQDARKRRKQMFKYIRVLRIFLETSGEWMKGLRSSGDAQNFNDRDLHR